MSTAELRADGRRELVVKAMGLEAERVLSLTLTAPDGAALPAWAPGAHIDLELAPGLVRQYSLCGDPADRGRWQVAVLHERNSRGGSEHVHTRLRPGDRVRASDPRDTFGFEPAGRCLFVAGGIGITPIAPMVEAAAAAELDWELLYLGRRRAAMAFIERIERHGERVTVWCSGDRGGRFDAASLAAERMRVGWTVYGCGPESLVAALERAAPPDGPGTLRVERFRVAREAILTADDGSFEVELRRSGLSVVVPPGQTILEAVEAAGVTPRCSCCSGACGTCETTVLEGIPDHRDLVLTPDEREAGETMMICVSRAKTPRLVLDL